MKEVHFAEESSLSSISLPGQEKLQPSEAAVLLYLTDIKVNDDTLCGILQYFRFVAATSTRAKNADNNSTQRAARRSKSSKLPTDIMM